MERGDINREFYRHPLFLAQASIFDDILEIRRLLFVLPCTDGSHFSALHQRVFVWVRGQPGWCLVNEWRSKVRSDHNAQIVTPHPHKETLHLSLSLFLSPSRALYSLLPLYERLLFKTLRSDLVPTEAIPLAALCIYHGSPTLSRLLTLQFSCRPPSFIFYFTFSHIHTIPTSARSSSSLSSPLRALLLASLVSYF